MNNEIFGPILPVLEWSDVSDIFYNVRSKSKPLALYIFSNDKDFRKNIMKNLSFGGGAVNDTINHIVNPNLPFGGIGNSGIGKYHGKYSFDTFTHLKSILIRKNNPAADKMFPPYDETKTDFIHKLFR